MTLLQLNKYAREVALWREGLKKLDEAESLMRSLRKAVNSEFNCVQYAWLGEMKAWLQSMFSAN